ncbi:MAG: beta-phosphoglucomutase [Cyclobacteriaceae bacterium]
MGVIKGCIFDLDGVIVDTAHYHFLAWKRLANELGYNLTESENERLKGVSRMQSLEIILHLAGISLNEEHKEMLARKKNTWFIDYVEQMTPDEIFPGVKQLIRELKSHSIKVGLASSSQNAKTVIRLLRIQDEFEAIVDGNMIRHTKPHPEIFLTTAKKMALDPHACVVIEDAEAGVEAALAAGMKCIGIGSSVLLQKANKIFSRTSDVRLSTLRELELVNE